MNDSSERIFGVGKVLVLSSESLVSLLQVFDFLKSRHIHGAYVTELAPQFTNFLVDFLSLPSFFIRDIGLIIDLRQFDLIVFAHTVSQPFTLQFSLVGLQFSMMSGFLQLVQLTTVFADDTLKFELLLVQRFSLKFEMADFSLPMFVRQVEFGELAGGIENEP